MPVRARDGASGTPGPARLPSCGTTHSRPAGSRISPRALETCRRATHGSSSSSPPLSEEDGAAGHPTALAPRRRSLPHGLLERTEAWPRYPLRGPRQVSRSASSASTASASSGPNHSNRYGRTERAASKTPSSIRPPVRLAGSGHGQRPTPTTFLTKVLALVPFDRGGITYSVNRAERPVLPAARPTYPLPNRRPKSQLKRTYSPGIGLHRREMLISSGMRLALRPGGHMRLRDSHRSATEHEAERGGRAAELLGEPVARERELIFETKECLICRNEFELLRYACPHCGNSMAQPPSAEAAEFMQDRQYQASQLVDQGAELFQRNKFNKAEAEFHKAIEVNPWNATAHANIGLVMFRENRLEEAIRWWDKALEIDPRVAGVREMMESDRVQRARRERAAHTASDTDQDSCGQLTAAGAAMTRNDWEAAIRHYSAAIRLTDKGDLSLPFLLYGKPIIAFLYGERGNAHAHNGDYRSACADFDEALKRAPNDTRYLGQAGTSITGRPATRSQSGTIREHCRCCPAQATKQR